MISRKDYSYRLGYYSWKNQCLYKSINPHDQYLSYTLISPIRRVMSTITYVVVKIVSYKDVIL